MTLNTISVGLIVLLVVSGTGLLAVRAWQGVAQMSDGVSNWTHGEPISTSRCRLSLSRGRRRYFAVALGSKIEVYEDGFVIHSDLARLEMHRSQIDSLEVLTDDCVEIRGRGLTLRIRGISPEARIALAARPDQSRETG